MWSCGRRGFFLTPLLERGAAKPGGDCLFLSCGLVENWTHLSCYVSIGMPFMLRQASTLLTFVILSDVIRSIQSNDLTPQPIRSFAALRMTGRLCDPVGNWPACSYSLFPIPYSLFPIPFSPPVQSHTYPLFLLEKLPKIWIGTTSIPGQRKTIMIYQNAIVSSPTIRTLCFINSNWA